MLTKTQKLYSFDIFDTLITRNMSTPGTIFYIMECLLKKNGENCKFPQILLYTKFSPNYKINLTFAFDILTL